MHEDEEEDEEEFFQINLDRRADAFDSWETLGLLNLVEQKKDAKYAKMKACQKLAKKFVKENP